MTCVLSGFRCVQLFVTLWAIAHQAPLILQARILEWVAMPSSRGSSQPRIEPASFASLALAGSCFFTAVPLGSPQTKPTSEQRDLPGKNNELCNDKRVNSRK